MKWSSVSYLFVVIGQMKLHELITCKNMCTNIKHKKFNGE